MSSVTILWSRAPAWRYLTIAAICLTILAIVFPPPLRAPVPWAHPAWRPKASGASAQAAAPAMPCSQEGSLRSGPSAQKSVVTFQNNDVSSVRIYWLDLFGMRKSFGQVEPGTSAIQPTFAGNIWMMTNLKDECIGIFEVKAYPTTIRVKRQDAPAPTTANGNKP